MAAPPFRLRSAAGYAAVRPYYRRLPLTGRAYAWARWAICPFSRVEPLVPREGPILDLGCGAGLFAHYLALRGPARRVWGMDQDHGRIAVARRLSAGVSNLAFTCGDLRRTVLPPARAITLIDVLHHLAGPHHQSELLRACYQALAPGGLLLVKEIADRPRWKFAWNYLHDSLLSPGRLCFRGQRSMLHLLTGAGFLARCLPLPSPGPYPHVLYLATRPT